MHRLDSGHFAVEDSLRIAGRMIAFYEKRVAQHYQLPLPQGPPRLDAIREPETNCRQ